MPVEHVKLNKDLDYYLEDGRYVFTAHFHLMRGYCCGSGCRHCPYLPKHNKGNTEVAQSQDYLLKDENLAMVNTVIPNKLL